MQKSKLKNLVFERFEKRRMEIVKKRNRFQQEIDQDVHQLREAYGDEVVDDLGDLSLTMTQPKTKPAKGHRTPTKPKSKKTRSRSKRKRQRRTDGTPTIQSLLEEHVPTAIATIVASKEEFRARDIYSHLVDVSKIDISFNNVSLYMGRNAKKLGLTVEKRNEGERTARPTNFFRKAAKSKKAKPAGRVDWEGSITVALKGLRKGLTQAQLKDKLVKAGVPEEKFKGAGFHGALTRMVEQKTIKFTDDRYRP